MATTAVPAASQGRDRNAPGLFGDPPDGFEIAR
jgi:hypothetical protein